jgi:NAD(P)-dependent dehydrogenase (short-subunit alcohol dehydrogenase family)
MLLDRQVAIVTGAGTSIGRALALEFARHGAQVVCCGRRLKILEETVSQIEQAGGQALACALDVTDAGQVQAMLRQVVERHGRVDLLFNNAGSFQSIGPFWEADPAVWWQDVTTNLYGSMLTCRAVLPVMLKQDSGVIINMDGGGGAHGPNIGGSAYGCSKAALLRFSEGLARELEIAGSRVLVFCMNPGFVHTAMTQAIAESPEGQRWQPFVRDWIERGNTRDPRDCALAAMKLLAIADPSLNGCVFSVDTDFEAVERLKPHVRTENRFVLRTRTEKDP